jgi:hypothetical protein
VKTRMKIIQAGSWGSRPKRLLPTSEPCMLSGCQDWRVDSHK